MLKRSCILSKRFNTQQKPSAQQIMMYIRFIYIRTQAVNATGCCAFCRLVQYYILFQCVMVHFTQSHRKKLDQLLFAPSEDTLMITSLRQTPDISNCHKFAGLFPILLGYCKSVLRPHYSLGSRKINLSGLFTGTYVHYIYIHAVQPAGNNI